MSDDTSSGGVSRRDLLGKGAATLIGANLATGVSGAA